MLALMDRWEIQVQKEQKVDLAAEEK